MNTPEVKPPPAAGRSRMADGLFLAVALAGGVALALQAGVNAQLKASMGTPMQTVLVSFGVGIALALVYCLVAGYSWPSRGELAAAPWTAWLGGLLGVAYLWCVVAAAPKVGTGVTLALVVAGQMTTALVLDHFGALGLPVYAASPVRLLGLLLMVGGAGLLAAFK